MIGSFFKIALRNLLRHKIYATINITGLAMGMAICMLILFFVRHEISYDRFHTNADQIYRVTSEINWSGGKEAAASAQFPIADVIKDEFPQVSNACRLYRANVNVVLEYQEQQFSESQFFFTDPAFLHLFDVEMLSGDPATALSAPGNVVITDRIARKYFGDENPLGKVIEHQNNRPLKVTGVVRAFGENSHFSFDFLVPFSFYPNIDRLPGNWYWNAFWTYISLPPSVAPATLEAQFPALVKKYFPEAIREGTFLHLQPLLDIHLRSQLSNEIESNGNILYIYIFAAIATLVLLIACINFMNLSTARSSQRAKEVGVRKVLGAYRHSIIGQFLGEAILMSLLAFILALCLVEISLPYFNDLFGQDLQTNYFQSWSIPVLLAGITLLVGIISGSYPAFFLSAFRPVNILKGNFFGSIGRRIGGSQILRKLLVTGQFAITIILLIGIGIISEQIDYFQNKSLGFEQSSLMLIRSRPAVNQNYEAFENALETNTAVQEVTRAMGSFPGKPSWGYRFVPEGYTQEQPIAMQILYADYDFVETMQMEIVNGRDFSRNFPGDQQQAFIINEAAAEMLGWEGDEILGKKMAYFGSGSEEIEKTGEVVGVVKNFHNKSLHSQIEPLIITLTWPRMGHVAVKLHPGHDAAAIEFIESTWQQFVPDWPIEYSFLDNTLQQQYAGEEQLSEIINHFAFLAIFIACLGLFGLSAYTSEQRTKEIGIRKVLGATTPGIIHLISRQFTTLIIFANIIAWPLAYWAMNSWLQNFAYRIEIGWQVFLLAGVSAFLIAITTISYQAIKAATANPVKALRYE